MLLNGRRIRIVRIAETLVELPIRERKLVMTTMKSMIFQQSLRYVPSPKANPMAKTFNNLPFRGITFKMNSERKMDMKISSNMLKMSVSFVFTIFPERR